MDFMQAAKQKIWAMEAYLHSACYICIRVTTKAGGVVKVTCSLSFQVTRWQLLYNSYIILLLIWTESLGGQ